MFAVNKSSRPKRKRQQNVGHWGYLTFLQQSEHKRNTINKNPYNATCQNRNVSIIPSKVYPLLSETSNNNCEQKRQSLIFPRISQHNSLTSLPINSQINQSGFARADGKFFIINSLACWGFSVLAVILLWRESPRSFLGYNPDIRVAIFLVYRTQTDIVDDRRCLLCFIWYHSANIINTASIPPNKELNLSMKQYIGIKSCTCTANISSKKFRNIYKFVMAGLNFSIPYFYFWNEVSEIAI